jgi:nucleotide-binding universal stress UspA family protein
MIPEIKKILYATDLSANSGYVLRYALDAAKRHKAKLVVLHVIEELPPTATQLAESFMGNEKINALSADSKVSARERFLKRLQAACKENLCIDLDGDERIESIEVHEGHTADLILSKAEEYGCDVIFMGTHGKGFLKHPYFGSTSKRVLRRVRIPVFIVPLPEGETDVTIFDE